jgi:hypothetical protein
MEKPSLVLKIPSPVFSKPSAEMPMPSPVLKFPAIFSRAGSGVV